MYTRQTKRQIALTRALRVARHSTLAGFEPDAITIIQFSRIQAPFTKRSDKLFARALCEVIALEAGIDTYKLGLNELFVVCSIVIHRYKLKMRSPPAYSIITEFEL